MASEEPGPMHAVPPMTATSADKRTPDERKLLEIIRAAADPVAEQAFGALLESYMGDMTARAKWRLIGWAAASVDEAIATARVRVWRRLRNRPFTLKDGTSFKAYLRRVVENVVIDTLREVGRDKSRNDSLDWLTDHHGGDLAADVSDSVPDSLQPPNGDRFKSPAVWETELSQAAMDAMSLEQLSSQVGQSPHFSEIFSKVSPELTARIGTGNVQRYDQDGRSYAMRAIARLRQPRRDCFHLKYMWGLEHAIIGTLLELTEKQVTEYVFEAKKQVREVLSFLWWEEEAYSERQIAAELKIPVAEVPTYIQRGRKLYYRPTKQEGSR